MVVRFGTSQYVTGPLSTCGQWHLRAGVRFAPVRVRRNPAGPGGGQFTSGLSETISPVPPGKTPLTCGYIVSPRYLAANGETPPDLQGILFRRIPKNY